MNRKEAEKLAKQIEREAPECRVTDTLVDRGGRYPAYVLSVTDTRTGDSFLVPNPESWTERHNWAKLAAENK